MNAPADLAPDLTATIREPPWTKLNPDDPIIAGDEARVHGSKHAWGAVDLAWIGKTPREYAVFHDFFPEDCVRRPVSVEVPGFQIRKNKDKPQLATLVPLGALEAIARAAEVGLVKYRKDSYREEGGYSLSQCLDSAVRHIFARTGGERYDADASALLGKPVDHLHMAIWNLSAACEALRPNVPVHADMDPDDWTLRRGQQTIQERA